jgi:hypothetical protein
MFALKARIVTTVGKRDMPVHALKSRTNFGLNFVRLLNAEFRDFSAENLCTQIPETDENKGTQFQDLSAARQHRNRMSNRSTGIGRFLYAKEHFYTFRNSVSPLETTKPLCR